MERWTLNDPEAVELIAQRAQINKALRQRRLNATKFHNAINVSGSPWPAKPTQTHGPHVNPTIESSQAKKFFDQIEIENSQKALRERYADEYPYII